MTCTEQNPFKVFFERIISSFNLEKLSIDNLFLNEETIITKRITQFWYIHGNLYTLRNIIDEIFFVLNVTIIS